MRSSRFARTGTALLLCAAVLAVSGCGRSGNAVSGGDAGSLTPSGTTAASSSVLASVAATAPITEDAAATGGPATGSTTNGSGTTGARGLSSADVKAIDAELSAIEKELDRMSLPSDSDFGGIESGLE